MRISDWSGDVCSSDLQAASVAVILALLSAPAANAEDCTTNADAMREKISAFQKQAQDAYGTIQSEFGKSTSSSYSKDYFAKFEDLNKGAKEATDLVTKGYDIANYVKPLAEGTIRTTMPPVVTNTMGNAVRSEEHTSESSHYCASRLPSS